MHNMNYLVLNPFFQTKMSVAEIKSHLKNTFVGSFFNKRIQQCNSSSRFSNLLFYISLAHAILWMNY